MMRIAMAGAVLAMGLCGGPGWAQEAAARSNDLPSTQAFPLKYVGQVNEGNEIFTAVRNLLPPNFKVFYIPGQNTIFVQGTPEIMALAQKVIGELDHPKKLYRLTYTITEIEGGKKAGVQQFSLAVEDGQRVTLKQGSKVPIVTGGISKDAPTLLNQVQYLDIGMNFDATLTSIAGGGVLKSKVEEMGVAEEKSGVGAQDPVIRQTTLEGTSVLTLGKTLKLGSVDVPGSTRNLDVEVMMELVK